MLRTAGIEPGKNARCAGRRCIGSARHQIVNTFPSRAIGDERLSPWIDLKSPGVDEPASQNFQFHIVGSKLPDPASTQAADAERRLEVAMDVNRLVEIKKAFRPPLKSMQDVMRILGAEPRKNDPRAIGLAVAVGIAEMQQLGAVGDIDAAVAWSNSRGDEQAIGKDADLVRFAYAARVGKDQNLVVGFLPRFDLRIDFGRRHPKPAGGIEVQLNRLGQQGVGREKVDLESGSHLERLAFQLGIGIGDFLEFALGPHRVREKQPESKQAKAFKKPMTGFHEKRSRVGW